MNDSIKRVQSQAGLSFAERENLRPEVKEKIFMKSAGARGYSRLARVMTLAVMLLAMAAGAWAEEGTLLTTITVDKNGNPVYSVAGKATLDTDNAGYDEDYLIWWCNGENYLTVTAAEGVTITKVKFTTNYAQSWEDEDAPYQLLLKDYTQYIGPDYTVELTGDGVKKIEVYGYEGSPESMSTTVKYALSVGDTFTSGQTVDVKDGTDVVATITYGETGGNEFKAAVSDSRVSGYPAFTEGNGKNGNQTGGTFYTIVPKYDGTITVAVFLYNSKPFYVLEDGTALTDYNGITKSQKYYGTFSFAVSKDKAYKFYCAGAKLGFYGFEYTYAGGSEPEPASDVLLTVKELTAADASTWGSDYFKNLSKTDMPGFQAVPQAAAKAWTEVPSGDVVLIYDYDSAEGEWLTCAFSNGSFFDFQSRDFSRKDIYDNISYGVSFYYTTGIQQQTEPTSGIVKLAEGTVDADKWTAKAGETGEFKALPLEDVAEGTKVTVKYGGDRRVKSVTAVTKAAAPALLSLKISKKYIIYYAEGETWRQAITNHATENQGWSISGEQIWIDGGILDDGGFDVTPDTPINPNGDYGTYSI